MPRMRALADARAMFERSAPPVMLAASAMCRNRRRSVRSKRIGPSRRYDRPSSRTKAGQGPSTLCVVNGAVNLRECLSVIAAAVAFTFLLAGFVKGMVGLGLPTVSIGLLSLVMTRAE